LATGGVAAKEDHDASAAIAQLAVHPELAASLFASEPMLTNPASIDVDHLGRVWICEAINYRAFRNADVIGDRTEGDRILVLEDSNGDAKADQRVVFYQGRDVDSAHGIMVMPAPDGKGTKAIVSALDSVFFLIDDDGDLKADRKELLFTGIDGVQHDHGIHAFHFGPDGKLYFNFGNAGKTIKDKHGQPIVDKLGHEVNDSRHPYQEGMVFRCNVDGSEFETLAWNFRNNWEVCVDSFGTMWQSDNDDDGNRGCRFNYAMEYGNYGYKDEMTGAAWSEPRTNWEAEIPRRHWHLNDPGVIPNVLQTGAGAPAGMCGYEGELLPERFRGALFQTDPGTNICRAFVLKADGAGYTADSVNILDGDRDKWFRPCDVCVAPDGSLLVADWYDPGVGGHRMEDIGHGRILRVTAKEAVASGYRVPAVDVSSPAGAAAALKSPNMATRCLAWSALQRFGQSAEPSLLEMRHSSNPVYQARALWLLGKLRRPDAMTAATARDAMQDKNSDIRITGIRLARQLVSQQRFKTLHDAVDLEDSSPAVRREILIAMHDAASLWDDAGDHRDNILRDWSRLARQYDGRDRWYLEALGIAAEGRWDGCLAALQHDLGVGWTSNEAGRDILWRSRGAKSGEQLAAVIADPQTPATEAPRFFRSLDFQPAEIRQQILPALAFGAKNGLADDQISLIRTESLSRLQGFDASQDPACMAVLETVLDDCAGSEQFVRLVEKFNIVGRYAGLLAIAQAQPESQLAVDALSVLYSKGRSDLIGGGLDDNDLDLAEKTIIAMTTAGDARGNGALFELLQDAARPLAVRRMAVKAIGASSAGAEKLLDMAQRHDYPDELKDALAAALGSARWPAVRESALAIFPLPPTKDSTPLPPLDDLIARAGDAARGKIVFNTTGTCAKCHKANGIGQDIGPDLSEIGNKLARQAMFESILYPSAAVSHNFETSVVVTDDGLTYRGILVSEDGKELKLKDETGILRTIPLSAVEQRSKADVSLMPANIQSMITQQELVDVVEYLASLKE
jgi:putative membrane-bound dehydrogenase-like protein